MERRYDKSRHNSKWDSNIIFKKISNSVVYGENNNVRMYRINFKFLILYNYIIILSK